MPMPNGIMKQPVIYGTNQAAGFQAAQQFEMAPNQFCIIVDSTAIEKPVIFFKSTNEYGMIKSFEAYECVRITDKLLQNQNGVPDMSKYATKEEIYDIVKKAINDTVGGSSS